MDELTVASVMTTRLVTAEPETPLRELGAKMTEGRVRAVPVVDRRGQPIGVVSDADLPPELEAPDGRSDRPRDARAGRERNAAEVMTTPVRAIHAHEPVSFAARLLGKAGVRRLFVVNRDSRLVGVVARRDLLRLYLPGDDDLRGRITGLLLAADIAPGAVGVRVHAGVATLDGAVARRRMADMIVRMVRALPGVVDVRDNLCYPADDVIDGVPTPRGRVHTTSKARFSRTLAGR